MLESEIQNKITKLYQKEGWMVVKLIKTTVNGICDLMCLRNGKTIFIEVKQPGKVPTPLQLFVHDELRKQGFDVFVMNKPEYKLPRGFCEHGKIESILIVK